MDNNKSITSAAAVLRRLEVPMLVVVPLGLLTCAVLNIEQSALLSILVAVAALGVFFASFEASRPALRQIMPTVVLAALAAAGRILFAPFPNFKPVSAICILTGVVFGRRCGFMVGALAALVSNFFFGQGPWTPWQMYSWGLIGYLAGVMADAGWFKAKPAVQADEHPAVGLKEEIRASLREVSPRLYVFGFLSAYIYGLLINGWYAIGFVRPFELGAVLLAYAAGLPFDTIHAVATVVFLAALYIPWRRKLLRIKSKFDLAAS